MLKKQCNFMFIISVVNNMQIKKDNHTPLKIGKGERRSKVTCAALIYASSNVYLVGPPQG